MPKKYQHLFFDLDHTLWDFDTNSEATLRDLYAELKLDEKATVDFSSRRAFIFKVGLGLASIPFGSMLYGITKGKYNYKVKKEIER